MEFKNHFIANCVSEKHLFSTRARPPVTLPVDPVRVVVRPARSSTLLLLRMAQRKWKDTKLQSGTAGPGNMLGCCSIPFHFLWGKLSTRTVLQDHGLICSVRNSNLGLCFFPFKCCVSQLSGDRFGNNFGGLMILGQVRSSPNFCSFGPPRAEKRNI